jgi:hypothetical protein
MALFLIEKHKQAVKRPTCGASPRPQKVINAGRTLQSIVELQDDSNIGVLIRSKPSWLRHRRINQQNQPDADR